MGTLSRTLTALENGANQFEPNQSLIYDMVMDWGATYSEGYPRIEEQFRPLIHRFPDPRRWELQQYYQFWSSGNEFVSGHGGQGRGVTKDPRWDQYHVMRCCWSTFRPFIEQLPFCTFIGMGSTRNWGTNGFDEVVREWLHWVPETLFLFDPASIYDRLGRENRMSNDLWHFADTRDVQKTFGKIARYTDGAWWCSQDLNSLVEHQMSQPLTGVKLRSAAGVNSPADRSNVGDVNSSPDGFDFFKTEMKITAHQKNLVRKFNSIGQCRFRYRRTHTIYSTPIHEQFNDPRGDEVGRPKDTEGVTFTEHLRKDVLHEDGQLPAHYDDVSNYGMEPSTTENTELSAEKVAEVMHREADEVEKTRASEREILKQKLADNSTATVDLVTNTLNECYLDDWHDLDGDDMRQHQMQKASKCIGWDRPFREGDYIFPV